MEQPLGRGPYLPGPAGRLQALRDAGQPITPASLGLVDAGGSGSGGANSLFGGLGPDGSDPDFASPAWTAALESFDAVSFEEARLLLPHTLRTAAGRPFRKVPRLLVLVAALTPSPSGDAFAQLKDPEGQMGAALHRDVLEAAGSQLGPRAVLLLQQVCVVSPCPGLCYLCITADNVMRVFPAQTPRQQRPMVLPRAAVPGAPRPATTQTGAHGGAEAAFPEVHQPPDRPKQPGPPQPQLQQQQQQQRRQEQQPSTSVAGPTRAPPREMRPPPHAQGPQQQPCTTRGAPDPPGSQSTSEVNVPEPSFGGFGFAFPGLGSQRGVLRRDLPSGPPRAAFASTPGGTDAAGGAAGSAAAAAAGRPVAAASGAGGFGGGGTHAGAPSAACRANIPGGNVGSPPPPLQQRPQQQQQRQQQHQSGSSAQAVGQGRGGAARPTASSGSSAPPSVGAGADGGGGGAVGGRKRRMVGLDDMDVDLDLDLELDTDAPGAVEFGRTRRSPLRSLNSQPPLVPLQQQQQHTHQEQLSRPGQLQQPHAKDHRQQQQREQQQAQPRGQEHCSQGQQQWPAQQQRPAQALWPAMQQQQHQHQQLHQGHGIMGGGGANISDGGGGSRPATARGATPAAPRHPPAPSGAPPAATQPNADQLAEPRLPPTQPQGPQQLQQAPATFLKGPSTQAVDAGAGGARCDGGSDKPGTTGGSGGGTGASGSIFARREAARDMPPPAAAPAVQRPPGHQSPLPRQGAPAARPVGASNPAARHLGAGGHAGKVSEPEAESEEEDEEEDADELDAAPMFSVLGKRRAEAPQPQAPSARPHPHPHLPQQQLPQLPQQQQQPPHQGPLRPLEPGPPGSHVGVAQRQLPAAAAPAGTAVPGGSASGPRRTGSVYMPSLGQIQSRGTQQQQQQQQQVPQVPQPGGRAGGGTAGPTVAAAGPAARGRDGGSGVEEPPSQQEVASGVRAPGGGARQGGAGAPWPPPPPRPLASALDLFYFASQSQPQTQRELPHPLPQPQQEQQQQQQQQPAGVSRVGTAPDPHQHDEHHEHPRTEQAGRVLRSAAPPPAFALRGLPGSTKGSGGTAASGQRDRAGFLSRAIFGGIGDEDALDLDDE